MKNYAEKHRDIARSVLPSTARKAARYNKANRSRRMRRQVTIRLHEWAQTENAYDYEGFMPDEARFGNWDDCIGGIVHERRNHDKLSVVRWAERTAAQKLRHLDDEERYNYFKAILPDNTIGRHALGHVADSIHPYRDNPFSLRRFPNPYFIWDETQSVYRWMTDKERAACHAKERQDRRSQLIEKLYRIITEGGHERFNRYLRQHHQSYHVRSRWDLSKKRWVSEKWTCKLCSPQPRVVEGVHDVKLWVDFVMLVSDRSGHSYYLNALDYFQG